MKTTLYSNPLEAWTVDSTTASSWFSSSESEVSDISEIKSIRLSFILENCLAEDTNSEIFSILLSA